MKWLLLIACVTRTAAPSATVEPIVVFGRITLAGVEEHAGIRVVLQGDYTNTTQTDAGGEYRFEGVPAGLYTLRASFGDFTREGEVTTPTGGEPGATVEVAALVLTPAGAIAGSVVTPQPRGIRVTLDGTDFLTSTDSEGRFYLPRVPVGTYRVRAEKVGFGGRTLRGVPVVFGEVTQLEPLAITEGVSADFNHAPVLGPLQRTPYQRAPRSMLDTLPYDLGATEVARYDTIALSAPATDLDGDRLTYFWSVSAGSLDRTDVETVYWHVADKAATTATISLRVVDERSAAAFAVETLQIVDAQALSGVLLPGGRALYAYRPFSQAWRVLTYDFASGVLTRVGELTSLDDPHVNLVGTHFHATPFASGDRTHVFWREGEAPAVHAVAASGIPAGGRLVQSAGSAVNAYDPTTRASSVLYTCTPEPCGNVEAASDTSVVSLSRSPLVAFSYDFTSGVRTRVALGAPVGSRVRTDGSALLYVDVPPGSGRIGPNTIIRTLLGGAGSDVYSGAFDVFIGAYDGRYVGYTEQAYRAVYAPERAFIRDTQTGTSVPVDATGDAWAQDDTFDARDGRILVRRYPRADWLQDSDRTHYQLVIHAR